ncbi:MAG: isoprenylcysteine carboxylmethyltransferase family protein [Neomegalonema sp.]|nr:isoprenylcysteine carboxylmethyltransferase family protein [Neomegalonema sp.]
MELPPVWLAAFLLLAYGLEEIAPLGLLPENLLVGRLVIGLGLALMIWAAAVMFRARTTVIPREQAAKLVTSGPFRFSRNPIYLADCLIMLGFGISDGTLWPILLIPAFAFVITRRFILGEEAMLRQIFGAQFSDWSSRVRRWV